MSLLARETFEQAPHKEVFAPYRETFVPPVQAMPLTEARAGVELKVVRLGRNRADALKLRSLGLTSDRPLSIFEGSGSRARILSIGSQRVAVGVDLADTILVEEVSQ
ncbi:hypothetical protein PsW64_00385 [Pseudovibrio sp. W64]|uniref:FeoA family protein n=1 Tax=unclassified Pseudovibrio TaxID=2627060 RepID=UPI00070C0BF6|nr:MULTISPECIES: FeoA family protein [unclassified Pseudovibrio]KZK90819.1 hypothetical protein PsW64_00385 [Pseudovibrio sp. W64]